MRWETNSGQCGTHRRPTCRRCVTIMDLDSTTITMTTTSNSCLGRTGEPLDLRTHQGWRKCSSSSNTGLRKSLARPRWFRGKLIPTRDSQRSGRFLTMLATAGTRSSYSSRLLMHQCQSSLRCGRRSTAISQSFRHSTMLTLPSGETTQEPSTLLTSTHRC
mgnify:FL=1